MVKKQINVRISDRTRHQIDIICESWGDTQTNVVSMAIDKLYQKEIAPKAKFSNISYRYPFGIGEEVTLLEYRQINPGIEFAIVGDDIREYFSDDRNDYEVVAVGL